MTKNNNVDVICGRDKILYCSPCCAVQAGYLKSEQTPLSDGADPDDCCEEYGQLCPVCGEEYHFTSKL